MSLLCLVCSTGCEFTFGSPKDSLKMGPNCFLFWEGDGVVVGAAL